MTQRRRRSEYQTATGCTQNAPPHPLFPTTTTITSAPQTQTQSATSTSTTPSDNKSLLQPEEATDGSSSRLQAQTKAAAATNATTKRNLAATVGATTAAASSMLVVTRLVEGLGQSLDTLLLRPLTASTLISRKQSQCFHYQPNYKTTSKMQQTNTTTTTSPQTISAAACTYKVDAVISRTSISSSISTSSPLATCRTQGFCHLLMTLSLVASLCLVGVAKAAPMPTTIKLTTNNNQLESMKHETVPIENSHKVSQANLRKQEPLVVIELDGPKATITTDGDDDVDADQKESRVSKNDDTVILVLTDLPSKDSSSSAASIRRLIKRSGISDQRLAEIQMIRALKKQLERASKLATSNLNSAGQETNST